MLEHMNNRARRHIVTLEDPIEYFFEDKLSVIEQREVGLDTASFATGLHNVLRQDPDVLVIGEMRGLDAVSTAVSAANVGTLVLSTLHTNDAARSIQRVLDFYSGGGARLCPAAARQHLGRGPLPEARQDNRGRAWCRRSKCFLTPAASPS